MRSTVNRGRPFLVLLAAIALIVSSFAMSPSSARAESAPANPNASQGVQDLLNYFYDISGHHILSGQFNYIDNPTYWTGQAQSIAGKTPAIWGGDFSWGETASYRQNLVDTAIAQWNSGSLVTLSWHEERPSDPANAGWDSVQGWYTDEEMTELVTPGTALYNAWASRVDAIAGYLEQLQDAGVTVLWRPYHENNASWFWWGGRPEQTKQLWINLYDRLTNVHHLNNLVWVWCAASYNQWSLPLADFYPGDAYVDIAAQDIYDGFQQSYYDDLVAVAGGKPIAIGEAGALPDIASLESSQPLYTYFLEWGDYLTSANTTAQVQAVYNHPYTLTRDELAIGGGGSDPGTGGIVAEGVYKLMNTNSGKMLDADGGGSADGTNVQIWTDNGTNAQKWLIQDVGGGAYKLLNVASYKALDVTGNGTADGTNVEIWTDNGTDAQKWYIVQKADGNYKLIHAGSGKALDVSAFGTADGTNVQIWTDNGGQNQEWQLIPQ